MNDKLQDALTDLIKNSTDFVSGQAPEVLQQLLTWEAHRLTAWLCIEAFILVAGSIGLFYGFRWAFKNNEEEACFPLAIGALAVFIFGFVFLTCDAMSLAKVTTAPKVWLLEYAAHYVGK